MPAAARIFDIVSINHCPGNTTAAGSSSDVFIESRGAHRYDDKNSSHDVDGPDPPCDTTHATKLNSGSSNVWINGKQAGRVGDTYTCGAKVNSGASHVFINDAYTPTPPLNTTALYHPAAAMDDLLDQLLYKSTGYYTVPSVAQKAAAKIFGSDGPSAVTRAPVKVSGPIITKVSDLPGFDIQLADELELIPDYLDKKRVLRANKIYMAENWYVVTFEKIPSFDAFLDFKEYGQEVRYFDFNVTPDQKIAVGFIKTSKYVMIDGVRVTVPIEARGLQKVTDGAKLLNAVFTSPKFKHIQGLYIESLTENGTMIFDRTMNKIAVAYHKNPVAVGKIYPMFGNPNFLMPNFAIDGEIIRFGRTVLGADGAPLLQAASKIPVLTEPWVTVPGVWRNSGASQNGYIKLPDFFEYVYKYKTPYADKVVVTKKMWDLAYLTGNDYDKLTKLVGEPRWLETFYREMDATERIASLKARADKGVPQWFWDRLKVKVSHNAGTVKEVIYASVTSPEAKRFYTFIGHTANIATVAMSPFIYNYIEERGGLLNHLKLKQEEYADRYLLTQPGVDLDKLPLAALVAMTAHDYSRSKQAVGEMIFIDVMDIILYFVGWPIAETYHAFDEAVDNLPDDESMFEWLMEDSSFLN